MLASFRTATVQPKIRLIRKGQKPPQDQKIKKIPSYMNPFSKKKKMVNREISSSGRGGWRCRLFWQRREENSGIWYRKKGGEEVQAETFLPGGLSEGEDWEEASGARGGREGNGTVSGGGNFSKGRGRFSNHQGVMLNAT